MCDVVKNGSDEFREIKRDMEKPEDVVEVELPKEVSSELPENLTPEHLTLLFKEEDEKLMSKVVTSIEKIENNELHYKFIWDSDNVKMLPHPWTINLDTLGREMKEWCAKQSTSGIGYAVKSVHYEKEVSCGLVGFPESVENKNASELEGVTKAFIWVAKEKKLLDEKDGTEL